MWQSLKRWGMGAAQLANRLAVPVAVVSWALRRLETPRHRMVATLVGADNDELHAEHVAAVLHAVSHMK